MKIYVNSQYEILALDSPPEEYAHCMEVDQTREQMFGSWCDACIAGHRYEPAYEYVFNEDGSNARDEATGGLLYRLDDSGEKIRNGWQCYPFVAYHTLLLIQRQYEDSQREVTALQLALADAYEQNLSLEESVTNNQLAIAQMYEGTEV